MSRGHDFFRVDPPELRRWLENVQINPVHIGHLPVNCGPGIMVTLPHHLGMPLIDGNHRAARSLRDGSVFVVQVLNQAETLQLLCLSMGIYRADVAWQRMLHSYPQPTEDKEKERP